MSLLLRPAPLLTLAALALGIAVCLYTAPAGLFLLVILLSWTFKYSIALLDALVTGTKAMPVLSVEMILGTLRQWRLLIALGLTILAFFVASSAFGFVSRGLLVMFAAALPILLPAVIAVQAWTHSTEQALRPALALSVARLLGTDYLRLVAVTAVLVLITAFVATRAPVLPVRVAACLVGWFAVLVVVGQVVSARRKDLEAATFFEPPLDPVQTAEQLATAREHAADQIYAHWRNGAKAEAWNAVERYVRSSRYPGEELLWLQRRVALWDAKPLHEKITTALQETNGGSGPFLRDRSQ